MDGDDKRFNILIFKPGGLFYGSTEKLLRQLAKILAKDFNVYFVYSGSENKNAETELSQAGVKIILFNFLAKQNREPFGFIGMQPSLAKLIKNYNINCVFTDVFAHFQFPINSIPASIPLVLISPFGHYCSNGNAAKIYVSGRDNFYRLKKRGIKNAELFFNPLEDFASEFLKKNPVGETVVFGRIGRGDNSIFDPISLKAFKKLESLYGARVKYIVVNPPQDWEKMAKDLGVKNMVFRPAITDQETLAKFYQEIDVLAHARKDGETVGIAIAEAMLAGNPILTHKSHFHNEHFDILDSSYALWTEADDSEKYFENMKWMVEHKQQIRAMGQLARKKAMEIFSMEKQVPKIIADFKQACEQYYGNTFLGRVKGYIHLYWENLKAMPFLFGKLITYKFPGLYKSLRKIYYR